jgi:putative sigma-54 modulation protein
MLIDTRAMGFTLTDAIVRHVEGRFESALGPFARRVLKITVRLDDVNGSRGGVDKRCSVVVALRRHGVEVAEAVDADLYRAIDEAAARIRRSVKRAAKSRLGRERRDPQRPGALVTV